MEKFQQILNTSCHVYISVTKQLNTCNQPDIYKRCKSSEDKQDISSILHFSSYFSKYMYNLIFKAFA